MLSSVPETQLDVARTAMRGVQELTCFSITKQVAASKHEFSYAQLGRSV